MVEKIYANAAESLKANIDGTKRARREVRTVTHEDISPAMLRKREALESCLATWFRHFFPHSFTMDFSSDHLEVIADIEESINRGRQKAVAMPRGSGKTTMMEAALIFAAITGKRRFCFILAADLESAKNIVASICIALQYSDELHEYYPEVTTYFRCLEGSALRAHGQIGADDMLTMIKMAKDRIVLPKVEGSRASEVVIRCAGITGGFRGAFYAATSGERIRPDLLMIDDPQTKESAGSVKQCQDRLATIKGDCLGLAGPGKTISCMVACTVIEEGDLATMLLDKTLMPEFQGSRMALVYEWPTAHETLWLEHYMPMYLDELRDGEGHAESTHYYESNRAEMDAGSRVAWDQRFVDGVELSAIQHAYNLMAQVGEDAFYAEYQNAPKSRTVALYDVDARLVGSRVNGFPKYSMPEDVEALVATIDINYSGLHFAVVGYKGEYTGYCVEWGCFPGVRQKLVPNSKDLTDAEIESLIWEGLTKLTKMLTERQYVRGTTRIGLELLTVDCGRWTKLVTDWCKQARFKGLRILPARGYANTKYKQTNVVGKFAGDGWHIADWKSGKIISRVLCHNADTFRAKMQRSFLKEPGGPGTLSLYGEDPREHRYIAEHASAEQIQEIIEGEIYDVYVWTIKPGTHNDLGDALAGTFPAAALMGVGSRSGASKKNTGKKKRKRRGSVTTTAI